MCILDVFFPLVWKKACNASKITQNFKIDQCMKKKKTMALPLVFSLNLQLHVFKNT